MKSSMVCVALNRIGATQTMEDFIAYTLGIAAAESGELKPVYSIVPNEPLTERIAAKLAGYQGHGPVRVGNAAADQIQHDPYASVILGATRCSSRTRLERQAQRLHRGAGLRRSRRQRLADAGARPDRTQRSAFRLHRARHR